MESVPVRWMSRMRFLVLSKTSALVATPSHGFELLWSHGFMAMFHGDREASNVKFA